MSPGSGRFLEYPHLCKELSSSWRALRNSKSLHTATKPLILLVETEVGIKYPHFYLAKYRGKSSRIPEMTFSHVRRKRVRVSTDFTRIYGVYCHLSRVVLI